MAHKSGLIMPQSVSLQSKFQHPRFSALGIIHFILLSIRSGLKVEEVMEMETSRVTRSASPVDSAVAVDSPDSAALVGAPDSTAQAHTEEEEEFEESGSGSGGSVEYSRTQMTETEEVIETEVREEK